jgi:predicted alpha/beta superfamily hydrolase
MRTWIFFLDFLFKSKLQVHSNMRLPLQMKIDAVLRKRLVLILFAGLVFQLNAQENRCKVAFSLISPDLPDTSSVYICGSQEELGLWNPSKMKMDYKGNHTWTKEIRITKSLTIEYKYTLGSWDRQGSDANGNPLQNFVLTVLGDTLVNDNVLFWMKGNSRKKITSYVTGKVNYHRQVKGKNILARDIVVWLPPGYNDSTSQRYPVLYMQDGQNIFDPATSAFGADWQIDETCDSLIRAKIIPPMIIVGIYNTPDRAKDYTPGVGGSAYMDFVVKKLKPFVDSVYRTRPTRKYTFVGGSSAGGLISFMLAWEYPQIFSKAICMSPAFKIMNIDYVKTVAAYKGEKKTCKFYIDNGGIGIETQLQPGIDAMLKALEGKGFKNGKDLLWIHYPEAGHSEPDWAKRFPSAIKWCMKDN